MTQLERVIHALRRGPVNPVDFLAPNVRDGGKPILRLGARIYDLRQKGHVISERAAKDGTAIYTLEVDVERDSRPTGGLPEQDRVFAAGASASTGPAVALGAHAPRGVDPDGRLAPAQAVPVPDGVSLSSTVGDHLFNAAEYAAPTSHHSWKEAA